MGLEMIVISTMLTLMIIMILDGFYANPLLTCSLADTSPTLFCDAKWVWMMRKQGPPMPLPTALVKFPSPEPDMMLW